MTTSRLNSVAGALAAASLLLGCSAHDPSRTATVASASQAERPVVEELARAERADRLEVGASSERGALEMRTQVDQAWEQGQAQWLAGDLESAFDSFDAGLDAVLASGLDLDAHPDLRRRVDDILDGVHHLAVDEALRDESAGPAAPELPSLEDTPAPRERIAAAEPTVLRTVHETTPSWLAGSTGEYTIPMKDHASVDAMVRFYTEKKRDHLERGLWRAGLYGPTVARIFEEEGVPADLMWLAVVESNYRTSAYSSAHAKGLWQFIPATGKRYGLSQDFWVDERADFEKATRSSARYMRFLHDTFGDWHLALAAYNAGEGKVGRGIKSTGRKDYWHLRRTRHLRPETKSYVPAMLAVMRIVRDPEAYGVNFEPAEPLQWDTARVSACADLSVLADCAGTNLETLKRLNPELRRGCTPGDANNYSLRVPEGSAERFQTRFAQLPPEKRLKWTNHRVRRGETLSTIARRYGSSVAGIMAANKLRSANRIGVGWELLIPRGDSARSLSSTALAANSPSKTRSSSSTRSKKTTAYRVRPGDTLVSIAKRHGTSVKSISQQNGIRNANRIRPGQRLTITGSASTSRSSKKASTYTVRRGDTLSGIAGRHGVSTAQLREWNRIDRRGLIHPGQVLAVRGAKAYSVRSGDTLTAIARRFDTSVAQLREWNDLNRKGLIRPGDRLTILSN